MAEYVQWVERLKQAIGQALDHFAMTLRDDTTINDLACAVASLIEGVWLNQCLTKHHPCERAEPVATLMRRSGLLLWRGATRKRSAA